MPVSFSAPNLRCIDPFQQHRQFASVDLHVRHAIGVLYTTECASLETLVTQNEMHAIPVQIRALCA